jgi:quinol monooxygenase YgiN
MKTTPLTVTARIVAKPGQESQVRDLLLSLLGPSRHDPGCLNYDLHQALEDQGQFLLHENWKNETLLEQHLQTPHVQSALGQLSDLVSQPPRITLWKQIGG